MHQFSRFLMGLIVAAGMSQGQTSLTNAVDFTANDAYGNVQHLQSYLDSGKYVLLEFSATT